ncbi:PGPGW domain-containing protein [Candidatus Nitrospira bockiana]
MEGWLTNEVLLGLFLLSAVGFIGSLVAIPIILVRLPPHYFDERHPRRWMENHHPILRLTGHIAKNVIGAVLLLAGLAMLFLPGQGVLTMLVGISLLDFPGKRQLERRLIGQPTVLHTINKLREKFGRPPLTVAHEA